MATSQVGGLPLFSDTTATEVTEFADSGILKSVSGVVSAISLAGNDETKFLNEQGAFTVPEGGAANPLGVIEPVSRWQFTGTGTAFVAANGSLFYKFRPPAAVTVSTIQVFIGTTSPTGNIDVGIYESSDGGTTLTRLRSSGSTAITAGSGMKAIALSSSLALVTGQDYWMAVALDNNTDSLARFAGIASLTNAQNWALYKTSNFPLGASVTTFASTNNIYYLGAY